MKKPVWLNKKVNLSDCRKVKRLLKELRLHTVCEESLCPNISECFVHGVASFMIMGNICTRSCSFCGVAKGVPAKVDDNEPQRVSQAVQILDLRYVVLTSPTRDDLADGGADMFYRTVRSIKDKDPAIKVEILIPDFNGNKQSLEKVVYSGADVITHNLETVPSLYIEVRKGSDYNKSLDILDNIKKLNPGVHTKSGIMLGLGEKKVLDVFKDLRKVNCDFLTLGQYLPPSKEHYPLKEFVLPEIFSSLEEQAYEMGFKNVKSSPYVRSSYLAHTCLD